MIPNYYMYGDFFDFEGLIFKTGKRVTLEKHSPIKQFKILDVERIMEHLFTY